MKKISFIFPIYKESAHIKENIFKILSDPYPSELKEIIIAVDCPTESFLEELKKFKYFKNIKLLISSERRGKVAAVNMATRYATGDIFVFIDSDAEIEYINLKDLVKDLEKADIVEVYKYIYPKSFWNRLYSLEFALYIDIIVPILSKKGSFFLNGIGFALNRYAWEKLNGYSKVIAEDADFGIRACEKGYIIKLSKSIVLKVDSLESFKKWVDQRKRWWSGGVEVIILHIKTIINYFLERPGSLILLLMLNPTVLYLIFVFIIPYIFLYSIAKAIYVGMVENLSILYLFFLSPASIFKIVLFFYNFFLFALSFTALIMIAFAIKKKKILNPIDVFMFVTAYSLIQTAIIAYVLLYYILFEGFPKFNWKVG